ncbi:hypothetical protein [Amycolatopsis sp. WAC 01375]|uniref:hypothetical protein n=1 Tax=Amycolatopsis sp. WAC 01375 TaxID=2203194 RepID=UPI000F79F459|nr:hypothetical protein [Amycolatopsis sp. WAC 01375]
MPETLPATAIAPRAVEKLRQTVRALAISVDVSPGDPSGRRTGYPTSPLWRWRGSSRPAPSRSGCAPPNSEVVGHFRLAGIMTGTNVGDQAVFLDDEPALNLSEGTPVRVIAVHGPDAIEFEHADGRVLTTLSSSLGPRTDHITTLSAPVVPAMNAGV